jgi:C4-dicarboxylate transporter, DctQ subunit
MSVLAKLHRLLLKTETLLLVIIVLSLILIAVTQVLLRNVFSGGLLWTDAYTRISVLWIAMLGAMLASRQQNHIAIDVAVQLLPAGWQKLAKRLNHGMTGLICFAAAWFSGDFLLQEYSYADKAFAEIPNWLCEAIIPFTFTVIALRYSIAALTGDSHDAT